MSPSTTVTAIDTDQLFTATVKPVPKTKIRPLGALSDFVVEQFPERLSAIRFVQTNPAPGRKPFGFGRATDTPDELVADIERLISGKTFTIPGLQHDLAFLDVMMLEAGLRAIGRVPATCLGILIEDFSRTTKQPQIITYQSIIMDNPPDDLRTFTHGVIGKHEADFYRGHQMIESCLWLGHRPLTTIH